MPPLLPPNAPGSSVAPQLRRHLLRLVLSVVVVDGLFIALQKRLGVDYWPETRRTLFLAVWMVLTLAVVLPTLAGIRATRQRGRQSRAGRRS